MRDFVTIDSSEFPFVVARYHAFLPTLEEFIKAQRDCENFNTTHSDFVLLIDLSVTPYLPYEYRILQAKWVDRTADEMRKHNMRVVFLTPSTAMQLLMKAIFLITRPKVPYTVVTTVAKARAWAREQLASEGKSAA